MSEKLDPYKLLEIDKSASIDDIKKAYKRQALKWHPDKNQHQKELANEKFKQISQAYEIISDLDKKTIFDKYGWKGEPQTQFEPRNMHNMQGFRFSTNSSRMSFTDSDELFKTFFAHQNQMPPHIMKIFSNRHGRISQPMPQCFRQETQNISVNIPLELLFKGGNRKYKITFSNFESKEIELNIEPGWKDGTKITFEHIINDIKYITIFNIKEMEHAQFKRNNNNLIIFVKLEQNSETKIKTLDNRTLTINEHSAIIPNEGMPIRQNKKVIGRGDLIVKFV